MNSLRKVSKVLAITLLMSQAGFVCAEDGIINRGTILLKKKISNLKKNFSSKEVASTAKVPSFVKKAYSFKKSIVDALWTNRNFKNDSKSICNGFKSFSVTTKDVIVNNVTFLAERAKKNPKITAAIVAGTVATSFLVYKVYGWLKSASEKKQNENMEKVDVALEN